MHIKLENNVKNLSNALTYFYKKIVCTQIIQLYEWLSAFGKWKDM